MEENLPRPGELANYLKKRSCFMCGIAEVELPEGDQFKYLKRAEIVKCLDMLLNKMILLISQGKKEEQIIQFLDEIDLNNMDFKPDEIDYIKRASKRSYEMRREFLQGGLNSLKPIMIRKK